ncbi:probable ATP-dependent RNA helicase DDX10 isoform X2 [Microplitis mediator]|uniref:probable ATP-dependent RNA helicase DDX10 isoform X2 n=1 Tax=Microplitis mediator TaxID=375433 RepID=UPI00255607A4|nr:probable ATP-dependent RNA helicase DDX10 isoform X2 [Microplitis mediator]
MAKLSNKHRKKTKIIIKKNSKPETILIKQLTAKYNKIDEANIKTFSDLPLSEQTQKGLAENGYKVPSDIQRQCIGVALQGKDILGAAKTGSGKTLAFLIPVIECLYREQWSALDGPGALIITPTRELAYQIFETLRKIGKYHNFSASLIIGGKDLKLERNRLERCNIIIGTPGRILQHMNENAGLSFDNMKILVLDEADRCLDFTFQKSIDAIIEFLPEERQSLLFSATQTKKVKDLARLSLEHPVYISIHEHTKYVTPENLRQNYAVCNINDKLAMLWSFLKQHQNQKIIVFFSTCKQTKYMYEAFCKLRPGIALTALYGRIHQLKRMSIYEKFCKTKRAALFATDIASRGLDFPDVHWVIQMDCPEDTDQYIHRVGRTARFQSDGQSLLVLLPKELKMVDKLIERKIPIKKINISENYLFSPHRKLESFLARDVELNQSAKRAFQSYIKSVDHMKDKEVFDVKSLDTDAYAISLGLAIAPKIRIKKKENKNKSNKIEDKLSADKSNDDTKENDNNEEDNEESSDEYENLSTKNDRKINNSINHDDSDNDDDFLTIKKKNVQIEDGDPDEFAEDFNDTPIDIHIKSKKKKVITKAAAAKKILHKKIIPNKKTIFDEEGKEVIDATKSKVSELAKQHENTDVSGIDIELSKKILREEDKIDKQRFREKVKEKHRELKRKLKELKNKKDSDEEDETSYHEENKRITDDSESEFESDGPDVSFLPDPDKIYGPKKDSNDDEDDESDEQPIHRAPKRKLLTQNDVKEKRSKLKIPKNSDLLATEELALQLLHN